MGQHPSSLTTPTHTFVLAHPTDDHAVLYGQKCYEQVHLISNYINAFSLVPHSNLNKFCFICEFLSVSFYPYIILPQRSLLHPPGPQPHQQSPLNLLCVRAPLTWIWRACIFHARLLRTSIPALHTLSIFPMERRLWRDHPAIMTRISNYGLYLLYPPPPPPIPVLSSLCYLRMVSLIFLWC